MTIQYKILIAAIIAMVLFGAGYTSGYVKASDHYAPIVAEKQALLDQITAQTKAAKLQQEKDNATLKAQADARVAAIRAYYYRLLPPASGNPGTSAGGNQGHDGTPSQSTITGCPAAVEQNCALDADMVNTWRAWCSAHKCPVKD
jgi:hypothetical protein